MDPRLPCFDHEMLSVDIYIGDHDLIRKRLNNSRDLRTARYMSIRITIFDFSRQLPTTDIHISPDETILIQMVNNQCNNKLIEPFRQSI